MALPLQRPDLAADLVLTQRAANLLPVRPAKRTIDAVVHAVVTDVQRREEHDPVAVHVALELPRGGEDLLLKIWRLGADQNASLFDAQRLLRETLGDHIAHAARVGRRRGQQCLERLVINEVRCPGT